jgi:two-component system, NarL family, sensor histidine kinase UhpB
VSLIQRFYLGLMAITLVIAAGAIWIVVHDAREAVRSEIQAVHELSSALLKSISLQEPGIEIVALSARVNQIISAVNSLGSRISLPSDDALAAAISESEMSTPGWYRRLVYPKADEIIHSATPILESQQLVLEIDATNAVEKSWLAARRVLIALGVFLTSVGAVTAWFGHRALRPLSDISKALENIDEGRYEMQLATVGIKEIDAVSARLNRLASERTRRDEEMTELARRALTIREEERKRLAHELHDEMGQSISAIKALAVSISQRDTSVEGRIKKSADTIADVSSHIYDKVRQLMSQLRPTALDELGLVTALEDMVDEWNSHHETLFCSFAVIGDLPPLNPTVGINLFRIVQEALTNIAKHANATQAAVVLEFLKRSSTDAGGILHLSIKDNGVGFDPGDTRRGLGLVGISERAAALHGHLSLATKPGSGTELKLTCNLQGTNPTDEQDQSPVSG